MSEIIKHGHEASSSNTEFMDQGYEIELNKSEKPTEESSEKHREHLEAVRKTIEKQAKSNESVSLDQETDKAPLPAHHYLTKHIKAEGYKTTIKHVQKILSPSEARFSKVIHQPKIEAISEFGAKTIARPKSIVSGSLVALLLGITTIIIANHIGFYITPLVISVLFVMGYILGLLLELLLKIVLGTFKHGRHYQ